MREATNEPDETPTPACPACGTPNTTWAICITCRIKTDTRLAELLELHALAQWPEHRIPAWRADGGQSCRPVGGDPWTPATAATDLNHAGILLNTDESDDIGDPPWSGLLTWAHDWCHEYETKRDLTLTWPTKGDHTLTGVVTFLRAHWANIAEFHPAADEFVTDVHRMWRWARAALRWDEWDGDDRPAYVIPCPSDHPDRPGQLCNHRLPVHRQPLPMTHLEKPTPIALNCDHCGAHWTVERLLMVAKAAGVDGWATRAEAAHILGVTPRTIRRMTADGRLQTRYGRVNITRQDTTA